MKCIDSGVYLKYEFIDSYEFKEWGETGIMLDKLAAYQCPECREIYPIIPKLKGLIEVIYRFKKGHYHYDGGKWTRVNEEKKE